MKTINPTQLVNTSRKWYLIDADGKNLWRLATRVAVLLKWKSKVDFAPHLDNWDYVVVLNAWKVAVTWNKAEDKIYHTHSGFIGWIKEINFNTLKAKKPTEALKLAISGMLPKNKLRDGMLDRLKLELGSTHKYEAQQPVTIEL
ncbi:MAG: 50S ribosomal protein L13 [uncultured bacterium (gcode 4)]|uniref:Large ribosomal subunit protein uL13 n=1 Tax=uncultured bacterium (gcode 4) TaxID=1234023 RepID=K2BW04_9BACT|nr:MAG: 50S ribosomal protein L13 [uncultured bacterium (gcode 4)]